ncbi:MAG: hypothetical protein HC781_20880 [Leptolyngbyaceae cyanobacterium CSU_1_4]|nr:hypothetical protein [Leptolyngbyaceae cyanobacterium CSU_1_4]
MRKTRAIATVSSAWLESSAKVGIVYRICGAIAHLLQTSIAPPPMLEPFDRPPQFLLDRPSCKTPDRLKHSIALLH